MSTWRCSTLTWGDPTLPSTLFRFTSEFGMESGGSKTLWSPSEFFIAEAIESLVLIPRIELGTSSLPRMRSTA